MHRPELFICCNMPSLKLLRSYTITARDAIRAYSLVQYDSTQHMLYMYS